MKKISSTFKYFIVVLFICSGYLLANELNDETHNQAKILTPTMARYAIGISPNYHTQISDLELEQANFDISLRRNISWRVLSFLTQQTTSRINNKNLEYWRSWYSAEEVQKINFYYQQNLKSNLPDIAYKKALNNIVLEVTNTPHWSTQRFEHWFNKMLFDNKANSLVGLTRTFYNPILTKHLVENTEQMSQCVKNSDEHCLVTHSPQDSMAIKTLWRRNLDNKRLAYKSDNEFFNYFNQIGQKSWSDYEYSIPINHKDQPYIIKSESGELYELMGFHVMWKRSDDWIWLSYWWSDTASNDFGHDKININNEWQNYKTCVVNNFEENASSVTAGKLSEIYQKISSETDKSWCSNPYLEQGTNNQLTNCIGCHQFAGTKTDSAQVLQKQDLGRAKEITELGSDYLWSLHSYPEILKLRLSQNFNK